LVKKKKVNDQTVFLCEICGLGYSNKETAKQCEQWCRKTGTCSIEITKKAVYIPTPFTKE
jgi:ABC-type uncharacterized transport system ATPase subunit